jgi:beta-phosphoglucomutase-like phosphatase (HAD superfamily)
MRIEPVFLFDLDGALVDSVYQHVLAWKPALDAEGIELSVWRIHRKIGMSGGLFTNQLLRETEVEIDPEGDRDQQPDGNSSGQPCCARRRSCTNPPVITRDQVRSAKPDPDLFSAAS